MALTETDKALILGAIGQPESANRIIQLLNEAGQSTGDFKADGSVPATGNFNLGNNRITNMAAPTAAGDAVNRSYVDAAAALFVLGPASSTDNAIMRYDGTTGKVAQNSAVTVTDVGAVQALRFQFAGNNNLMGSLSGNVLSSGIQNVLLGNSAGLLLTTTNNNTLVGHQAGSTSTSGAGNTAMGSLVRTGTSSTNLVVIGQGAGGASSTGSNGIIIGQGAATSAWSGSANIVIGQSAATSLSSGAQNIILGQSSGSTISTGSNNIIMAGFSGQPSSASASNEWIVGSQSAPISVAYFGQGYTSASLASFTLSTTSATGTDVSASAASLIIAGARGTGTGSGGSILFQTAAAGASGSSLNSLVQRGSISDTGLWGIGSVGGNLFHDVHGLGLEVNTPNNSDEAILFKNGTDGSFRFLGGTTAASGNVIAYGSTHATKPSYLELRSGTTAGVTVDNNIKVTIGHSGSTQTHEIHGALETAGAEVLTLANGPTGTAGNPGIYLRLNVNGTNYVFPGWAI